jgi:secondary thiamine-phosphate synthase enzyme
MVVVPMAFTGELHISTKEREEIIDVTKDIAAMVKKSGIGNGICLIHAMHATAAILVNENYDPSLKDDFIAFLKKQVPSGIWKHDQVDGNADAHIRSMIIGQSQSVPVKDGALALGRWQGICLVELDGPRERRISVTVVG